MCKFTTHNCGVPLVSLRMATKSSTFSDTSAFDSSNDAPSRRRYHTDSSSAKKFEPNHRRGTYLSNEYQFPEERVDETEETLRRDLENYKEAHLAAKRRQQQPLDGEDRRARDSLLRQYNLQNLSNRFSRLLRTWTFSKSEDAATRSEELLRYVVNLQRQVELPISIDTPCINQVLYAWAKAASRVGVAAAKRAESILKHMESLQGASSLGPNIQSYNAVMEAWSKSGNPHLALERAESLFERAHNNFDRNGRKDWKLAPTRVTYGLLMTILSDCNIPQRTDELLAEMEHLEQNNNQTYARIAPDGGTYTLVIRAWALSGLPEGPELAEACLRRLQKVYQERNERRLQPRRESYGCVIHAWAGSRESWGIYRAQRLYEEMFELHARGYEHILPNPAVYDKLIWHWSLSKEAAGPAMAETILRRGAESHRAGHTEVGPTVYSYVNVLNGWANREDLIGNAEHAEVILNMMIDNAAESKGQPPPKTNQFESVMRAWSRSSNPRAIDRMEMLLKRQLKLSIAGMPRINPNQRIFSLIIDTWKKSDRVNEASKRIPELEVLKAVKSCDLWKAGNSQRETR